MEKFDEYEFKAWVNQKVGFSIRKHFDYEHGTTEELDEKVDDAVNALSVMELVCLLGEYLTKEISDDQGTN